MQNAPPSHMKRPTGKHPQSRQLCVARPIRTAIATIYYRGTEYALALKQPKAIRGSICGFRIFLMKVHRNFLLTFSPLLQQTSSSVASYLIYMFLHYHTVMNIDYITYIKLHAEWPTLQYHHKLFSVQSVRCVAMRLSTRTVTHETTAPLNNLLNKFIEQINSRKRRRDDDGTYCISSIMHFCSIYYYVAMMPLKGSTHFYIVQAQQMLTKYCR